MALLLLPFGGKLRKAGKRLNRSISILILLGISIAATLGLSGLHIEGWLLRSTTGQPHCDHERNIWYALALNHGHPCS